MLLSIVLMMKNEEKFLDNTLKALNKIREKVESELIILDTGSIDKSVEIAKLYTDKVYFETWNNDFADMRNKSISYANGEWLLIIDADEELIEYEKMINFFKTDLHQKYNSASVELKNINSEDGKSYSKSANLRLFKRKGFRYEGAIHEQPMYKEPIYNNIAVFNHYGYLYVDEEFKHKKLKRNENILLQELKKNPDDPYINFQLGKNFMAINKKEEALYYMEKSMNLYEECKNIPSYIYSNLAKFYVELKQFDKCEKICIEYLQKKDDKNIDIYYFLALSQSFLYKYEESLNCYERYIYLVDNYDISTQANSIYADGITVGLKEYAQMNILKNYYYLGRYEQVIEKYKNMDFEEMKDVYDILFESLYKANKVSEILEIYNKKISSMVDTKYIEISLESMILKTKESDKSEIYKVLSNIDNDYGLLNKTRLGEKFTVKTLNRLLLDGKQSYYGEIIYYAIKNSLNILELLQNVSYSYMKGYFNYIIENKRDCLPKLYEFLLKVPNTLNLHKLNICSCISEVLLIDKGFANDKYEKIFYMYITYRYNFIKQVYNPNLSDEEIICLLKDKDDEFVVKINLVQKLKDKEPLKYIKKIKKLILDNEKYKKAIEILIDKFIKDINESEQIKKLKIQYKLLIENSINAGNIKDALIMINEYENMYSEDIEIINMKSIVCLLNNNYKEAEKLLKKSFILNFTNINTIFNIAYLKEVKHENKEAIMFYNKIMDISEDESLILEAKEKIKLLQESLS
ncbi:glycosyltransferase [Terrisporobacter mayombei]|nr:glycosyltransferase [Terrisporobacter mayombei]MCC3869512.1 glycosyltransferase [Terrisporobacter mayombei]